LTPSAEESFEPKGFVYAIARSDAIKIGWSGRHPRRARLSQLQCSSPDKLQLIGTIIGTLSDEAAIHDRFAAYHIRGEWFHWNDEILTFFQNNDVLP